MKQITKRQHHTPEFYLYPWTDEEDGKLCVIRNIGGRINKIRRRPRYTGFEEHLYSYTEDFPAPDRAEVETKFFSPLDNEGAKIVRKFIKGDELDNREMVLWAQFLCAMRVRTPENVTRIKNEAMDYMTRAFESDQPKYEASRNPEDPEKYIDWIALQKPGLLENIGVSLIPKISSSQQALSDILRMSWYAVQFLDSVPLLTSDRPLVVTTGLQNPDCIITLPLSPQCAFFSFYPESKAQRVLMSTPVKRLARAINDNVVSQAKKRVYSQNDSDAPDGFYEKRLSSSV